MLCSGNRHAFTPLEKATDFSRWLSSRKANGGIKPPLAQTVRERSSLTGFTFVEMMVVLVLFAVIGVSLLSSFIMGMKVWKRVTNTNFVERKALLGIVRLSKELRNSFGYSKIGFDGRDHNITFANIVGDQVVNMTYIFVPEEGVVYRYNMSMGQMSGLQEAGLPRKIISGIKDFSFKFYGRDQATGNNTFLDSWNYTVSGIPAAVKVSCSVDDDHDFEKIISIPVAQ